MRRVILISISILALSGCADLSAVSKFSQSAPDVASLDSLTAIYVGDPQTEIDWQSIWTTPDPALASESAIRLKQKATLDDLHSLIVNYMKAIGGASGPKATDISTQAKAVSTNLAALQKIGSVDLTTTQVTSIGDLLTIIPQDLLNIYRANQIGKIIRENQKPFQAALATEVDIVNGAYISDFSIARATVVSTRNKTDTLFPPSSDSAVTRAAKFAFDRDVENELNRLDTATAAANKYVIALQKLSKAYDVLVAQSDHLNASTLQAILPLLNDANKAYADIQKL